MSRNGNLIAHLKKTLEIIENSPRYEWGNLGACNCGHLAQAITGHSRQEIHEWAMEKEGVDWSQKSKYYCPDSGYRIDDIFGTLLKAGFQLEDIHHIEYLNHPEILRHMGASKKGLARNSKKNLYDYLSAWVSLLEKMQANQSLWNVKSPQPREEVEIYDSVPEQTYK